MKPPTNPASGILLVDKPQGITSHDVVARTRKLAGTRKIGHAGTLDPMATGLLVLGMNSSTRLLTFMVGLGKEYSATIRLGQSSDTDDAEGTLGEAVDASAIGDDQIAAGIARLTGEISQVPSSFSAIKVDGKRAYALARAGEDVELKSRTVTISAFEVLATRRSAPFIDLDVRVECSSGTYIRALARDLGDALGVGGHLTALRRSRVGPFDVADAATLETLVVNDRLLSPASVATALFPSHTLDGQDVIDLVHGKRLTVEGLESTAGPIAGLGPDGRLVGLLEVRGSTVRAIVNFPTDEVLE
ncbi:tRNA pseudouridine(55) synthase TruB [Conyzicola nivalis]|uniref:tRNA pseudouridine synthase B n=1 Tax=Conyzicola nivalis TaxID=1477021 RepID=A0A916WEB8_9MICO|nr:tRNA pseudouridine(55) synthase TruB [Conyzicola nivalis]GGA92712.1 tRNA pseudouridine synthase B [Conyzicola nivalis]